MKAAKAPPKADKPDIRCSFCNKHQDDVRKVIAGPMVYICDQCVGICIDILVEDDEEARGVATEDTVALPASQVIRCSFCERREPLATLWRVRDLGLFCTKCKAHFQGALEPGTDAAT